MSLFQIDTFDGESNILVRDASKTAVSLAVLNAGARRTGTSGHASLVLNDHAASDAPRFVLLSLQAVNCQP